MRTTRRSSLPDTQRPTTERLQCGRHGGHPSPDTQRSTTVLLQCGRHGGHPPIHSAIHYCTIAMRTTRRTSLPDIQNAPSEPAHCGLSSSYYNKTKARKPNLQTFAPLNFATFTRPKGFCHFHTPEGLLPPSHARRAFATFTRPKGFCHLHTPEGLLPPSHARRAFATFTRPKGFCHFHTPEGLSPSATCFRMRSRGRLARSHDAAGAMHSSG